MNQSSEQKVHIWHSFIQSLNPNELNRTVKVISGTYLQGEFLLIPDPGTYETVGNLVNCVKIGAKMEEQPRFQNKVKISLADGTVLGKGEELALLGMEEGVHGKMLKCQLIQREKHPVVHLPMNCRGVFQECHDDNYYTLDQILKWKIAVGRSRIVKPVTGAPAFKEHFSIFPKNFSGQLLLQPSYSIKAILSGEVETLIPAQLDFEIVDITDMVKNPIVGTTYLEDIYTMANDKFPLTVQVADIMGKSCRLNMKDKCNSTYLEAGQYLTILGRVEMKKYLATEVSQHPARKHFLIPQNYSALFQRIPRTFQTVYDLELARKASGMIEVIATQSYIADLEGLSSFVTGDGFRTVKPANVSTLAGMQPQIIPVLICKTVSTRDIVALPMYAVGSFLEVLKDREVFTIDELLVHHKPPCCVKVICQGQSLPSRLLFGINELQIDGEVNMKYLIVKRTQASAEPFEIPVELVKVMVTMVSQELPPCGEQVFNLPLPATVEALSAEDYKLLKGCDVCPAPPPLPPKFRSRIPSHHQMQIRPFPPRVTGATLLLPNETTELSETHSQNRRKLQNIYLMEPV
ncbi:protein THEMIS3-like isoform X2 [Stegostoma tigrinum]|uniref:protein THEMIS3-like isoform X2 n=1 Tax=Stegostoma tigrinum TaxID=3053191 RepID=UPI00202B76E4|nr:protein THEMIS3-like isoform X2 [Stegostoma tigrinum]